jgi:hypothetical protein
MVEATTTAETTTAQVTAQVTATDEVTATETVKVVSMEEREAILMPEPDTELYIPESLLAMELEDKDMFLRTSKGEFQRICFSNLTLTDGEIIHWRKFIDHCAENELVVPEAYLDY